MAVIDCAVRIMIGCRNDKIELTIAIMWSGDEGNHLHIRDGEINGDSTTWNQLYIKWDLFNFLKWQ